MGSDVGFATIGQRIAGLATLRQQLAPPGPPATAPRGGSAFAETLEAQLAEQVHSPTRPQGTALPVAHGATPSWLDGTVRPPTLPSGVRLSGQPSLITPARPGQSLAEAFGLPAPVDAHTDHGHVHGPPALDRSGPPSELVAFGNGRIPPSALEPLGVGDHSLWAPAARAFRDLQAAATRDGVHIGVNDSYRSYERQVEMVDRYGLYSQGGRAASPGTSNHGWGVALDLQLDDSAQAWMREHGADYGFVEDVPREPWHWTFKASDYPG